MLYNIFPESFCSHKNHEDNKFSSDAGYVQKSITMSKRKTAGKTYCISRYSAIKSTFFSMIYINDNHLFQRPQIPTKCKLPVILKIKLQMVVYFHLEIITD